MDLDGSSCFGVRPGALASEWGLLSQRVCLVSAWSSAGGKEALSFSLTPAIVAKLELGSSNENGLAPELVSLSPKNDGWHKDLSLHIEPCFSWLTFKTAAFVLLNLLCS